MSVTARGKRWEILHSLWIGWTFTLGFFNWVAFLYIGIRAKQRKWILWGLFYSTPFILAMLTPNSRSWLWSVVVALTLLLGIIGIIHAFRIRDEYLLHLEVLQRRKSRPEEESQGQRARYEGGSWRVPKPELVAALDVSLTTGRLKVAQGLPLWPALREELLTFRRKIDLKTAHVSFKHHTASGHGDLVIATALALWKAGVA